MILKDAVEALYAYVSSGRSLRNLIENDERRRLNAAIMADLEYGRS